VGDDPSAGDLGRPATTSATVIVSLSAFAVLRLMTSSNFVGCSSWNSRVTHIEDDCESYGSREQFPEEFHPLRE
jgi:hypothetical protein